METTTAQKIRSLSQGEIAAILKKSFFIIGKKMEIAPGEIDIFLNEIIKYQGSMLLSDFEDAFSAFAGGTLQPPEHSPMLKPEVSPMFVSRLMRLYKDVKYGKQTIKYNPAQAETCEIKWQRFFIHLQAYGIIEPNADWISLFNHCVNKGWITEVPPIPEWNYKSYMIARRDVMRLVQANWGEMIKGDNVYNPETAQGRVRGIGSRMRESYGG